MSIRFKYLVLLPLTALLPILVFYYYTNHFITTSVISIQHNRIERDIEAVEHAVKSVGTALAQEAARFGMWDELYESILEEDLGMLVEEMPSRLSAVSGTFMSALISEDGRVLFLSGAWRENDTLRIASSIGRGRPGVREKYSLEQLAGGLAVVARAPILRGDKSGTQRGTILLATNVKPELVNKWRSSLKSSFVVYLGLDPFVTGEGFIAGKSLSQDKWNDLYTRFSEGESIVWEKPKAAFPISAFSPLVGAGGHVVGIVELVAPYEDLLSFKANLNKTTIIIFVVVALIAMVLAFLLSFYIVGRITSLNVAIRGVLSGETTPDYKAPKIASDELDELLLSFMRMKEELDGYLRQLIASELKYRRVVNTSISGLFVYGRGKYQFCNPQFEVMTGYSLDELNEQEPLAYIHPEDVESFIERVIFQLAGWTLEQTEDTRIITKSGEQKMLNFRVEIIDYQEQQALLGHVLDVTEQRHLERQLFHAQKLESIGTLAGGIAHDFNNIIGAIIGFAEMISERYPGDERLTSITERILKLGYRASRLVKHLVVFARGERATMEVIDVEESVGRVLEIFVLQKHLNIKVGCKFPESKVYLKFSPVQFDQMLVNLLVNARDSMPDGGSIQIDVERLRDGEGDGEPKVVIRVEDDGCGISQEYLDRIFDPFFSTKEVGKGTGLGLAVVYGVVESHGGRIEVKSEVNTGTTFELIFPEASPNPSAEQAEAILDRKEN